MKGPIPAATLDALKGFGEDHKPVGDFLRCLLSNDLFGALHWIDEKNAKALFTIAAYVHNRLPFTSWGTPGAVVKWLNGAPPRHEDAPASHEATGG